MSWQLLFKLPKCMVMHVGNHNPHFSYTIDWQVLSEVTERKDLGVVFDGALKFHSHVFTVVSKANRTLGMIKKCFTALNQSTLLVLYKNLVRTQYCNTVWKLSYWTDVTKLRRTMRILPTLNYKERQHHLNLPSLSYRQFRSDMLTTFQVRTKWFCGSWCHWVLLISHTRCHSYKIFTNWCQKEIFY